MKSGIKIAMKKGFFFRQGSRTPRKITVETSEISENDRNRTQKERNKVRSPLVTEPFTQRRKRSVSYVQAGDAVKRANACNRREQ